MSHIRSWLSKIDDPCFEIGSNISQSMTEQEHRERDCGYVEFRSGSF